MSASLRSVDGQDEEVTGQSQRRLQRGHVRRIARDTGRRVVRNIAGQQRVVHMEQQGQQIQNRLLSGQQAFHCPLQTRFIDGQKPLTHLIENLSIDSFAQSGSYFQGARHYKPRPARQTRKRKEGEFTASSTKGLGRLYF